MTTTTNYGLKKIDDSDNWRTIGDDHNDSMDSIESALTGQDAAVANLADGLAIVTNGNTHAAIAEGQYVYVRKHSSLAEGLYKAKSAISANATLSTSNLTADSAGGLNDLKGQVDSLNSKLTIRSSEIQNAPAGTSINTIQYNDYFVVIAYTSANKVWAEGDSFGTIPDNVRPNATTRTTGNTYANNVGVQIRMDALGNVTFDSKNSVEGRISFTVMYLLS